MRPTEGGQRGYVALVCLVAALGGLLFGYDTAVISGTIGFLQEHFELTATLKGWAASSALLGCVLGVSFAGLFSDRLGRKKTLVLAGLLFLISAIGTALPQTLAAWMSQRIGQGEASLSSIFLCFVLFRIVGGVGVGVASMASPMYIAEITPARIRGRMVSVNQLAIVSGILLIYFVNYSIEGLGDHAWNVSTGWRWMFGSGVLPSVLFLALLGLVPESPRWLMEQGRNDQAEHILNRVGGAAFAAAEAASIRASIALEKQQSVGFQTPGIGRPLVLGVVLAILQQVTGINVFLYYAPEIFKTLGSRIDAALLQTVVIGGVNLAFTLVAIFTVDLLGRKPLMIVGSLGMVALVALGLWPFLALPPLWALGFMLAYIAFFALSVGPVTWVLLAEIFHNRIRGRRHCRSPPSALWTASFVVSQTFPMMDENAWLVENFRHGFRSSSMPSCLVLALIVWLAVPETRDRSLEEIEKSWTAGTAPRAGPPG
ncbi:MAG: sugar porter family MFS transporter [Gemmataceae bacterium]